MNRPVVLLTSTQLITLDAGNVTDVRCRAHTLAQFNRGAELRLSNFRSRTIYMHSQTVAVVALSPTDNKRSVSFRYL